MRTPVAAIADEMPTRARTSSTSAVRNGWCAWLERTEAASTASAAAASIAASIIASASFAATSVVFGSRSSMCGRNTAAASIVVRTRRASSSRCSPRPTMAPGKAPTTEPIVTTVTTSGHS